ncbi:hypothetical protein BYT27DRAFT_6807511 [Phlegmacium glaucopus]|nr:hypothetical protein BYT27DRAFT_6807511 [Phlegmacium glaucopus]
MLGPRIRGHYPQIIDGHYCYWSTVTSPILVTGWMAIVFLNLYCNDTTFNSVNTTYLSPAGGHRQFTNAICTLNVDAANSPSIYIYDATASTWSTQQVVTGTFDPSNFATILDHDTNVFYVFSNGELFSPNMALLKVATSTPIPWLDVRKPDLPVEQLLSSLIRVFNKSLLIYRMMDLRLMLSMSRLLLL